MTNPPARPLHMHLVLTQPDGKGESYLNGWDQVTLRSLDMSFCGGKVKLGYDQIFILPLDRPVQTEIFTSVMVGHEI